MLNGSIIVGLYGSLFTKTNIKRNDVLGSFDIPFSLEGVSINGYEDAVTTEDAIPMVVFSFVEGNKLKTRGNLTAGRWIGFTAVTFANITNN